MGKLLNRSRVACLVAVAGCGLELCGLPQQLPLIVAGLLLIAVAAWLGR